jgi:hypothetical protein
MKFCLESCNIMVIFIQPVPASLVIFLQSWVESFSLKNTFGRKTVNSMEQKTCVFCQNDVQEFHLRKETDISTWEKKNRRKNVWRRYIQGRIAIQIMFFCLILYSRLYLQYNIFTEWLCIYSLAESILCFV